MSLSPSLSVRDKSSQLKDLLEGDLVKAIESKKMDSTVVVDEQRNIVIAKAFASVGKTDEEAIEKHADLLARETLGLDIKGSIVCGQILDLHGGGVVALSYLGMSLPDAEALDQRALNEGISSQLKELSD